MAFPSGVQGQLLEITVVGCTKLRDTEWISRQDPYVCLDYATTKFRTRTHTDGGKNPTFNEKFSLTLIEGLREVSLAVWNSNTITTDDFIGSGKILLNKVLSQGYDDTAWSIISRRGKYAGEVRVIMHYANAQSSLAAQRPSAPPYSAPPPAPHHNPYAPPPASYPLAGHQAPSPYPSHSHMPASYAQSAYTHPPPAAAYPPALYPQQTYPPPANPYPPRTNPYLPSANPYPPPAPYPGIYPPPPY